MSTGKLLQSQGERQNSCSPEVGGIPKHTAINQSEAREFPPIVDEVLNSHGRPLDAATRAFFEPRFQYDFSGSHVQKTTMVSSTSLKMGHPKDPFEDDADRVANRVMSLPNRSEHQIDLSHVEIHTGERPAESARAVNALAYTVGNHIVFGKAQFAPGMTTGRHLLAHELAHVFQQQRSNSLRLSRADVPDAQERQFWLDLGKQPNYGVLPKDKRTLIASQTGNQQADEVLWTLQAVLDRADKMRMFLHSHFGSEKDFRVTSVTKPGEHTTYRKMDVARAGTTTWEELAAAAVHAGFWVHAEGVTLDGKLWPLSQNATGPHLDLYLIKIQAGDFPTPTDAIDASSDLT